MLVSVAGRGAPALLTDFTAPDGYRRRRWILADTIHFLSGGRLSYARWDRWAEQTPGSPEDVYDDFQRGGGWYEQQDDRVGVAWNLISVPTPDAFRDTLRVRADGLSRNVVTPPVCFTCPTGPLIEFLYARR